MQLFCCTGFKFASIFTESSEEGQHTVEREIWLQPVSWYVQHSRDWNGGKRGAEIWGLLWTVSLWGFWMTLRMRTIISWVLFTEAGMISVSSEINFMLFTSVYIYIYIYAFSRRFYPKWLTLHSSYSFTFDQLLLSLGIEPMILALLASCSTIWATGKPVYSKELELEARRK